MSAIYVFTEPSLVEKLRKLKEAETEKMVKKILERLGPLGKIKVSYSVFAKGIVGEEENRAIINGEVKVRQKTDSNRWTTGNCSKIRVEFLESRPNDLKELIGRRVIYKEISERTINMRKTLKFKEYHEIRILKD